jgi:hypothetical protein
MSSHFTEEQELQICSLYVKDRLSMQQVAATYGVNRKTIRKVLSRRGVVVRPPAETRRKLSAAQEGELCARYLRGEKAENLSKMYGLCASHIREIVQRKGHATRRNKKQLSCLELKEAFAAYEGGELIEVIAEGLGMSRSTLRRLFAESGLQTHQKGVKQRKDITGRRGGKLVAVRRVGVGNQGQSLWEFACDCGNTHRAPLSSFLRGNTKSCGCSYREANARRVKDIAGHRFGLLTARRLVSCEGLARWEFDCDCGGLHIANVSTVTRGNTQSCGCLSRGPDSVDAWLDGSFYKPFASCVLYVHRLKRFSDYLKIGIDSTGRRADKEYGPELLRIEGSRLQMWLLEQAILRETLRYACCPEPLLSKRWAGFREVRLLDLSQLDPLVCELHSHLLELSPTDFALSFLSLTKRQRERLLAAEPLPMLLPIGNLMIHDLEAAA